MVFYLLTIHEGENSIRLDNPLSINKYYLMPPQLFISVKFWSITTTGIVIITYLIFCWRNIDRKADLSNCILLVLASNGLVAGAQLIAFAIDDRFDNCFPVESQTIQEMYIIIGGLAVVWASFISMKRIFNIKNATIDES